MRRDDMIRLLTAYCNFNSFKTVDEFSGDRMMTLDEGKNLLDWLEHTMKMNPPCLPDQYCQALYDVYIDPNTNKWEEVVEQDQKVMDRVKVRESWKRNTNE